MKTLNPPYPAPEDLEQLKNFIVNKAKELAEETTHRRPDWFTREEATLTKLIKTATPPSDPPLQPGN